MSTDLRYDALIVDHDDTSVMSTPCIHYPAHVEALRQLRPGREPIGLAGWFRKNLDPGLMGYLAGELGFSREELAMNHAIWRSYTTSSIPAFFPGFIETLVEFRKRGGCIIVISHSEEEIIARDYRAAAITGTPFFPDALYGWKEEPELRKPSPRPLLSAMARFGLDPKRVLVLDDLKPSADMAAAAGVDCAAAGWGHDIPEIRDTMRAICMSYFTSIDDFSDFLLKISRDSPLR